MFKCLSVVQYLKVSMPDEVVTSIENILMNKHEKEECMKSLFMHARNIAYSAIGELLSDYRSKRSLG
jgi:Regulator of G protein signalling-like domain